MTARLATLALFVVTIAVATPAIGQTDPAVETLAGQALYVEEGAEAVDERAVLDAIDIAVGYGVDLRVAVLAAGTDSQSGARSIGTALGSGTVLVFTPDSYGVFSNEVSQSRLDDALVAAQDELSGPDVAVGTAAFAEALNTDSGGVSAGLAVAVIVAVLVVVGVGGRLWEVKTRATRQARRRDRRRVELTDRTRRLGDKVLELSDPVELADDPDLARSYAEATGRFDEAELTIAGATTMDELDTVEQRLEEAEAMLDEIRTALRDGGSRS